MITSSFRRGATLLAAPLLSLTACASGPVALVPQSVDGRSPELTYDDGVALAKCGESGAVAASREDGELTILVLVRNDGSDEFLFDPKGIVLHPYYGDEAVPALAKSEWMDLLESRQNAAKFWTGVAAGLNSYSAGAQGYSTTTYSGTYSDGYGHGWYSGTATTYDPYKASLARQQANAENQEMFARLADAHARERAAWSQAYLGRTTLSPGEEAVGVVKILMRPIDRYDVTIRMPDGDHEVVFVEPSDP